jgi:hypothetical protein
MTKNRAMKISAFVGGIVTGATGGVVLGPWGIALGALGAAAVGFPLLFHDAPTRPPRPPRSSGRGVPDQIHDDEDPRCG